MYMVDHPPKTKSTSPIAPPGCGPHVNRVLSGLLEISHMVGSVMLLDDILERIAGITSTLMDVPVVSIYIKDDNGDLVLRSNIGFEEDLRGRARFAPEHGIPGWVAQTGEPVALSDARQNEHYEPLPSALELHCKAYLCVPLRIQEEIIGIMTARKREVYEWTSDDILFFETVCKNVAIVIEKARMYQDKIQAERLAAVAVSLSGVAHYIKNVLLTMKGGEYLVDQGLNSGELVRAKEGWDVLRRANKKIRNLVENMLNYSRKSEPIRRPIDLNAMIADLVRSVEDTARDRGIEVVPELDDTLEEIWVDPEQIYDSLLNLVTNAMDALSEAGETADGQPPKVIVRTQRLTDRKQALIEVIDNGPGITAENQEKLFTLFFSTKGKMGTGIGLAATRKIVEDHLGSIELNTYAEHGAHFMIYLPTTEPEISTDASI